MTRSLIISAPIDEAAAINAALEAAGKGPNNLSVPMRGDQIVDLGQHTHLGCHWWATDDEVELVKTLQQSIAKQSVVRDEPAQIQPLGLFNATVGDFVQIEHKQFQDNRWGWRATMKTASGKFQPGVRAIAIYADDKHQKYLYTTGAFILKDGVWSTEWNAGNATRQTFYWALLWASVRETLSTLKADASADVAYLQYGLPVPDGPTKPDVIEWAPGQQVAVNDKRTWMGITYNCRQAHTTQAGWEPPNVLALWLPV
jgi:hypothetical protein